MTNSDKAKRALVSIGTLQVEGFQMPDGSYRMSQTQAAECIGKPEINARRFLDSKGIKALLGKGYTPDKIEADASDQVRGGTRFNALPLEVISAYWLWEASKGNEQALTLSYALMTETLERRFDAAFGVQRSEADYDARLIERVSRAEFDALAEAYAEPDLLREENERLKQQIRELGGEPWQLSPAE